MTIYNPSYADGYEFCQPVDRRDFKKIRRFVDGSPHADSWKPIEVKVLHDFRGRQLKRSDCPWYGRYALIFRESVVAALGPLFLAHGELLPLACKEANLMLFNITRMLPAIDEAASGVTHWGGAIHDV